jgi:two-component system, NarL family, sensor kinase
MSRTGRVLVIVAAWTIPVAWLVVALGAGPSDGTAVWSSPITSDARWGDTITIQETYGDSPFRVGDQIDAIDGKPVTAWLAGQVTDDISEGQTVPYQVRRPEQGIAREFTYNVVVHRYPFRAALGDQLPIVATALLMLLAGSLAFWWRPGSPATRAFLGAAAFLPFGLASVPFGLGAIDLAGSRGTWPHVVAEVVCTLGLGLALLAAVALGAPKGWLAARPWIVPIALLLPFVGYAVWALLTVASTDPGPERQQSLLSVVVPSLAFVVPVVLAVLAFTYWKARSREVRLAARMSLLVLVSGIVVRFLLGDLPDRIAGAPILPWDVLLLLIAPAVLAGLVVALVGYRLDVIEPAVRRTVVQGLVAALVGTAFVAVASAIGSAADVSVGSILAGGVVALGVLPVAVALQRGVRRLVYGDADLPRTLVSELRRLDATAAPSDALTETLAVLTRRLRLAHASIEASGGEDADPVVAAVGEPSGGTPVTVDLVAGGVALGTLRLEPASDRDPFGRGDRRLLEDVGAQVGTLVQAVLANRELQRSRQQLVTAREEERRRIRRDLHDGLGPSLATMAMRLESTQDLIGEDPAQAAEVVGDLADLARGEIAEVRRLVDGLRPAALDQLGLVSALRQRAVRHEMTSGDDALAWAVEADDDVEPLPAAVEVAAYRIALEAVTNAIRHSGARHCTVSLRRDGDDLRVLIRDDGQGLAADRHTGVGLFSMRERAAELGGTCTVTSDASGTLVDARLPVGDMTSGG